MRARRAEQAGKAVRGRASAATRLLAGLALAGLLAAQDGPREQVGPAPGGGFLLNSGWRIRPVGRQAPLDTFPMAAALAPDGKHVVVLNGGYNPPSLSLIDPAAAREISRTPLADGWFGLAFSPKGDLLYVGGGSQAAVFEFSFKAGKLTPARTFSVVAPEKRTPRDFIGDVAVQPGGRMIYAADLYNDAIVVINPQSGAVIERFKTGRRPYRILFHPDGQSFFVTSWADGSVLHHDADKGTILSRTRVGAHPTDMVWSETAEPEEEPASSERPGLRRRLFVAAANTNNVYAISVSESKELRLGEAINISMTPRQPAGMTPSGLALSRDGRRLFVVCSDANAVAVVDISGLRGRILGFIPTGWYPTAVRVLPNGRLMILNGRGMRSFPNPQGPNPTQGAATSSPQYVARLQRGTAQIIEPFGEAELEAYTRTVLENSPYRDEKLLDAGTPPGNPVPVRPGDPSPIEHVVYIIKENRTYDQILGDLKEGNGDASLCLFPERVTPNHHKLAREFVLLDNFYVNSDVDADGLHWSTAAIAPDYVQKLWQNSYARRRRQHDYEGQEPTAVPPAGYLWTNAAAAGLSIRNYGHFVNNRPKPAADGTQILSVRDSVLAPVTNMRYRGFDLNYPDVERAKVFLEDLAEMEKTGQFPRLVLMRLGNDHTSANAPGCVAPHSAVADNDYALGMIVEGLSKSRFWAKMAIFVLEDDAQDGPDHVDSHRSPAFVISPYVKRGAVDSTMYNTASMLRTLELILGLRPMTHFDAAARPMASVFQDRADVRPYTAEKPRVPLDERNPAGSATAHSLRLNFSEAGCADRQEPNKALWPALRPGQGVSPPARNFFAP